MWRYVTISLIQIIQVQRNSNENQVKNTSTIIIGLIKQLEKQIVCNSVQTTDFETKKMNLLLRFNISTEITSYSQEPVPSPNSSE